MLLAIDIGNTDVSFGVFKETVKLHEWRTPTLSTKSAYHYQSNIQLELLEAEISPYEIETVVISSVVPDQTSIMETLMGHLIQAKPILAGPDACAGLSLDIDYPYELGSDLIANAVAAYYRYRKNCIVVDFGTALTFSAVTADARVLGVAIVPGLNTAVKSLFSHTAQLPEVPLVLPERAIGTNTVHSIQSGVLIGYEGLVKTLLARFKAEIGEPCVTIATGGLSSIIDSLKSEFTEVDKGLTLDGLRIIGEKVSG